MFEHIKEEAHEAANWAMENKGKAALLGLAGCGVALVARELLMKEAAATAIDVAGTDAASAVFSQARQTGSRAILLLPEDELAAAKMFGRELPAGTHEALNKLVAELPSAAADERIYMASTNNPASLDESLRTSLDKLIGQGTHTVDLPGLQRVNGKLLMIDEQPFFSHETITYPRPQVAMPEFGPLARPSTSADVEAMLKRFRTGNWFPKSTLKTVVESDLHPIRPPNMID